MLTHNWYAATIRIIAIVLKAMATALVLLPVVFVNFVTFGLLCQIEPVTLCLLGGGGVVFAGMTTTLLPRYLLLPKAQLVALTAVLVALVWTVPLLPGPRFFAAVSQIKAGMTVREVQRRLPTYPMACDIPPQYLLPDEVAEAARGIAPHFTGYVICKITPGSNVWAEFIVKDGIVTHIDCHNGME